MILGILAATAMPKFVDLRIEARNAATDTVAAALSSGLNIAYVLCASYPNDTTKCPSVVKADLKNQFGGFDAAALPYYVTGATPTSPTVIGGTAYYVVIRAVKSDKSKNLTLQNAANYQSSTEVDYEVPIVAPPWLQ